MTLTLQHWGLILTTTTEVHEAAETPLEHARSYPLAQQLEALLIVAETPLSATQLAAATQRPTGEVVAELKRLQCDYDGTPADDPEAAQTAVRGFELREIAGGWRFYARADFDALIVDFVHETTTTRLSQAALETLTVVAYRQPISRGAISSIRAVNVDSVVRTLVSRGLITEVDHDPETGAALYGTTDLLLEHLGIESLDELPPVAPLLEDGSEGFESEEGER